MKSKFFKNEIAVQKKRPNPDENYMRLMSILLDKEVTKEHYINTGRIMDIHRYQKEYGQNKKLQSECLDLVRYAGGFVIQILKSGEWMLDYFDGSETFKGSTIQEAEDKLWEDKVKSLVA